MRTNVCVNEMALFGPFAAFVKGKTLFDSHGEKGVFGGTLVIGLITEPLGFVQDAQDVMVLFGEWLAVLVLCSVRVLDEPSAGRNYVCRDCLVVNGTSKFIINTSSRYSC